MERIVEPELMEDNNQCIEYNIISNKLYNTDDFIIAYKRYCNISEGILVDLGCGPAHHLVKLKQEFPKLNIFGYDGSGIMVALAKSNTKGLGINIEQLTFDQINIQADCVISLQTLHHQHNANLFWTSVKRLCKPNGKIFVDDLERPNDRDIFNNVIANTDFKNSLQAAFTISEVEQQVKMLNLSVERYQINLDPAIHKLYIYQNK